MFKAKFNEWITKFDRWKTESSKGVPQPIMCFLQHVYQQRREARDRAYQRLRERYKVVIEPATPDGQATPESG